MDSHEKLFGCEFAADWNNDGPESTLQLSELGVDLTGKKKVYLFSSLSSSNARARFFA